jgi:hypothetical protein
MQTAPKPFQTLEDLEAYQLAREFRKAPIRSAISRFNVPTF